MADLLIVVERLKDWKSYYPTDNVVSFQDYLTQTEGSRPASTRVLNGDGLYTLIMEEFLRRLERKRSGVK